MRMGFSLLGYPRQVPSESFKLFLETEPPLKELLEHSETEAELKTGNNLLDKYLDRGKVEFLIRMVTEEPGPDSEPAEAFKFPLLAAEFFSGSFVQGAKLLAEDAELLTLLFSFFERDDSDNPVLAGYFSKVFVGVYSEFPDTVLGHVFESGCHTKLVQHLNNDSTAQVLRACLSATNCVNHFLSSRLDLVEMLVDALGGSGLSPLYAQKVLCSVIVDKISINLYEALMEYLLMEMNIEKLLGLLGEQKNVPIVCEVLEGVVEILDDFTEQRPLVVRQLCGGLGALWGLLCQDCGSSLGPGRLAVLSVFSRLLMLCEPELDNRVLHSNILSTVTGLFFAFEWNSLLSGAYYGIVMNVISGQNESLKKNLLRDCELLKFMRFTVENPYTEINLRKFRRGHLGYIFKIGGLIRSAGKYDHTVQELIARDLDWGVFEKLLEAQLELEAKDLGAKATNLFDQISSEEEEPLGGALAGAGSGLLAVRSNDFGGEVNIEDFQLQLGEYYDNSYWSIQKTIDDLDDLE